MGNKKNEIMFHIRKTENMYLTSVAYSELNRCVDTLR